MFCTLTHSVTLALSVPYTLLLILTHEIVVSVKMFMIFSHFILSKTKTTKTNPKEERTKKKFAVKKKHTKEVYGKIITLHLWHTIKTMHFGNNSYWNFSNTYITYYFDLFLFGERFI